MSKHYRVFSAASPAGTPVPVDRMRWFSPAWVAQVERDIVEGDQSRTVCPCCDRRLVIRRDGDGMILDGDHLWLKGGG